jgi:hypothetical protein
VPCATCLDDGYILSLILRVCVPCATCLESLVPCATWHICHVSGIAGAIRLASRIQPLRVRVAAVWAASVLCALRRVWECSISPRLVRVSVCLCLKTEG